MLCPRTVAISTDLGLGSHICPLDGDPFAEFPRSRCARAQAQKSDQLTGIRTRQLLRARSAQESSVALEAG
jgi:hypothetical protein